MSGPGGEPITCLTGRKDFKVEKEIEVTGDGGGM